MNLEGRPGVRDIFSAYYRSRFPQSLCSIDIELTDRCNLRCPGCWFYGENGVGDRYAGKELRTDEVLRLIDEIVPYRPAVYFGGAEPLLRDDFLEIVTEVKLRGLYAAFTTNGTLMTPDLGKRLVDACVDSISLSLDGPERVHDQLRGQGNYEKSVRNLRHLLDYRRQIGATEPLATINITVNPGVVGLLSETIEGVRAATDDQVDSYRIHHLWFVNAEELKLHQAAVEKALGCSAPGAASHLYPSLEQIDLDTLCEETLRLEGSSKVSSFPDVWGESVRGFYSKSSSPAGWCHSPFHKVLIKPDGEVRFCPDEWIDDYVLGNIRDRSLDEIWRGRQARRFRWRMVSRGPFPGCRRCSWFT